MPHYSRRSLVNLSGCTDHVQEVFNEVIKHFDCVILCGYRDKQEQDAAFNADPPTTSKQWPNSKHNQMPSPAVDAAPYPIDWTDRERFTMFAGFVLGVAASKGYRFRWGGDWDSDTQVKDNNFDDLPHFEEV